MRFCFDASPCENCAIVLKVEAMGEALVVIGASNGWGPFPLTAQQADLVLKELTAEMLRIGADVTTLRQRSESGTEKGTPICLIYRLFHQ